MSIAWYRNYGFRPPEVDPRCKGKPAPKYFIKDSCLTAPNMRLDDPAMFEMWLTLKVRRVVPGLVPVPKPMRLPPPNVVAAMVKEMLGYEPKGHAAEVAKPLIDNSTDYRPNLEEYLKPTDRTSDEYWEKIRKEILEKGPLPMATITARMPRDCDGTSGILKSTSDGIYPIRNMIHVHPT